MSLFTSSHFASACASGTDWRDTSKEILEKLDEIRKGSDVFNLGFLYISDHLADDATSIFNLFKSVLKIENWVGSVGAGVIGCGESYMNRPAISAMIGRFPEDSFCVFPAEEGSDSSALSQDKVADWFEKYTPMLGLVHADPMADNDPRETLKNLELTTDAFLIGGLTSSRGDHYQIANAVYENEVSGVFFADTVPVSTTLSQGCEPIGAFHTVTKVDDHTILELDDRPALDVFQVDLRECAAKKIGKDVNDFMTDIESIKASEYVPDEFQNLFQGRVHVALPLSQSDQNDYMVRNITGIDADERSISITETIANGDTLFFVERHENSVAADLSRALVSLRNRVQAERQCFEPKAALYISCVARGFSEKDAKESSDNKEVSLIRNVIGDIPMVGFYAGGEINNARLYGYTGILALFF